jgi:MFS family permease
MTADHRTLPDARKSRIGIIALLSAAGVSTLGTRMSALAIPWFVLAVTGSPAATGLVIFAEMGPYVIVQGLGGPLVDRIGARRMAIFGELAAGVAMGAIPALYAADLLGFGVLAAVAAVAGAAQGLSATAQHVLVPGLSDGAGMRYERAAGLFDGINRVAAMIGIPLAGLLIVVISSPGVIALDAVSFLISCGLIGLAVPRSAEPAPSPEEDESSYPQRLAQGFRYLRSDRLLLGIAAMVLVTNLIDAANASVFLPVWGRVVLGNPLGIGLAGGVFGVGAVTGNALLTWLAPRLPRRLVYGIGFFLAGAPRYVVLALATTVPPLAVVSFIAGFGAGSINPILGAVEYERVPRHLQARVLGVVGALAWAGIPFGGLLGGAGVEAFGLTPTLLVAGSIYLLTTMAPFVFPAWREMDHRPIDAGELATGAPGLEAGS